MRLKEIQAKTPQQARIASLKQNADNAKNTYKNEKNNHNCIFDVFIFTAF